MSDETNEKTILENCFADFWYSGNPRLNIILAEDIDIYSVMAIKDREQLERAKWEKEVYEGKLKRERTER